MPIDDAGTTLFVCELVSASEHGSSIDEKPGGFFTSLRKAKDPAGSNKSIKPRRPGRTPDGAMKLKFEKSFSFILSPNWARIN